MKCQSLIVLWCSVLAAGENKLTKLWSMSSASNSDGSVVNVTSASVVIQPSSYDASVKPYARYAFKPRAIPLKVEQQVEKNSYYSRDVKYKRNPRLLFPGNFYPISKEKSNETERQRQARFVPVEIPLIRNEEFQRRSLDADEEPIIERPEEFVEQAASRRSISDMLGVNDDDDEDEDEELEGEYEIEEIEDGKNKNKRKRKTKLKSHKMKKYMLPLLLAYKMKYFTLVPVMIGGLVLLVGATGMAGFFFALFAAVMGLQKGGY